MSEPIKYRFTRKHFAWGLTIMMFAVYLYPLGLPMPTTDYTVKFYNFIESLGPEDKPILISIDYATGCWGEMHPSAVVLLKHLMSRGARFVIIGIARPESNPVMTTLLKDTQADTKLTYGVDYVAIGYIPGQETAIAGLSTEFQTIAPRDLAGNMLSDLPLTKDIKDCYGFSAVITIDCTGPGSGFVRNWQVGKGVPTYGIVLSGMLVSWNAYVQIGQAAGVLAGLSMGAEYERITGFLGDAVKSTDVLSITHILAVFVIVLGNVELYIGRKKE